VSLALPDHFAFGDGGDGAGEQLELGLQLLDGVFAGVRRLLDQPVPAYIQALLEQTADSLDNLQRTIARSEEGRMQADLNLKALTDRLSLITEQRRAEQQLIAKISENQGELRPWLNRIADLAAQGSFGIDEATRQHLRNVDLQLGRLIEEMAVSRDYTVKELRAEIKLLTRTIAVAATGEPVRER
jgi:hypothetical protein